MNPFRTSLTARLVSISIAIALTGIGAAAVLGAPWALPYVILTAVVGCVVGVIAGALEHTGASAALAVALPILLWPYLMVAELILRRAPTYGWGLIALGALVASSTVFAAAIKPRRYWRVPVQARENVPL